MFIKREKLMKPGDNHDPRAIQGTSAKANVILGPHVAGIQQAIKGKWNKHKNIYFPSGDSAEDLGEWFGRYSDKYRHIYENDFSRFDSSIHKDLLKEVEFAVYQKMGLVQSDYDTFEAH